MRTELTVEDIRERVTKNVTPWKQEFLNQLNNHQQETLPRSSMSVTYKAYYAILSITLLFRLT